MFRLYRKFNDIRGQSIVEFALVLPILLTLIFAIADFGNVYHQYNNATEAAREGARRAIGQGNETQIKDAVHRQDASYTVGISFSDIKMKAPYDTTIAAAGSTVTVTVTKKINFLTPMKAIFLAVLPGESISATCTMMF